MFVCLFDPLDLHFHSAVVAQGFEWRKVELEVSQPQACKAPERYPLQHSLEDMLALLQDAVGFAVEDTVMVPAGGVVLLALVAQVVGQQNHECLGKQVEKAGVAQPSAVILQEVCGAVGMQDASQTGVPEEQPLVVVLVVVLVEGLHPSGETLEGGVLALVVAALVAEEEPVQDHVQSLVSVLNGFVAGVLEGSVKEELEVLEGLLEVRGGLLKEVELQEISQAVAEVEVTARLVGPLL